MAVEAANDHIGIAIVQTIWDIKLELSIWPSGSFNWKSMWATRFPQ